MTDPVMIDLVGDNENQLPAQLQNIAVLSHSIKDKMTSIKNFVIANRSKKIMIFTQTKKQAIDFGYEKYANFLPIHGDLS